MATASIGQVHRATLANGSKVVVKVLHPGIEQALRTDFRAASLAKGIGQLLMPGAEIAPVLKEARAAFPAECDCDAEKRWQERFAELYAGDRTLSIAAVHAEWCSQRVLASDWTDGLTFDAFAANASQPARDRAGRALYEFYVGSLYGHGLFNADPQPGNLTFQADGRHTVLDFGCVREFEPALRASLKALSKAVRLDDTEAMKAALVALGGELPNAKFWPEARAMLRGFFGPVLEPGAHRLEAAVKADFARLVADKRAVFRLRLPARLLFLFRIRFGLYAELAKLGAVADWAELERQLSGS